MSYRIFIVEDHPVMREAYASVLELEAGLDLCDAVASAEEALTSLADGRCDLVVTDYSLPGMNGVELVRRLRTLRPGLPSIVISGHEEEAFAREARAAGAATFLKKRDLIETLVPTILAILDAGPVREAA